MTQLPVTLLSTGLNQNVRDEPLFTVADVDWMNYFRDPVELANDPPDVWAERILHFYDLGKRIQQWLDAQPGRIKVPPNHMLLDILVDGVIVDRQTVGVTFPVVDESVPRTEGSP